MSEKSGRRNNKRWGREKLYDKDEADDDEDSDTNDDDELDTDMIDERESPDDASILGSFWAFQFNLFDSLLDL